MAKIGACCFAALVATPLVMLLLLGRVSDTSNAPIPKWDPELVRDGEWMRGFERSLREGSHATRWLRAIDAVTWAPLGLSPPPMMLGQWRYETEDGEVFEGDRMLEAIMQGFLVEVPWRAPRPRMMVGPGQRFYLSYGDHEVLRRSWFDQRGRVLVQLNQYAMRDRMDLAEGRRPGERRVLCLGDSITFGWGVPAHLTWVRRLEQSLRDAYPDVSTINAGGAGTVCIDEYQTALELRFHVFEPDAVVVATSCNDLLPNNGLAVFAPSGAKATGAVLGNTPQDPLQLDPSIDWVAYLRKLGPEQSYADGYCGYDRPHDSMWDSGTPQRSLLRMRDWCRGRGLPLVVAMWPFLQGMGPGRHYAFEAMHREVAAWCAANGIVFVDLLPVLREVQQEDLWVTPADMHPNPLGHALAARAIDAALAPLLRR